MKVLAVLIIVLGLVVVIVPQFTNCEYGKEQPATIEMQTSASGTAEYVSLGSMETSSQGSTSVPYRMMKCFWSARAEVIAGVPLIALGALLVFARRKETFLTIGALTTVIGVLAVLIPTAVVGTCANPAMVCNTEMKPTLLTAGGITAVVGVAVLVLGVLRRPTDGGPSEAVAA